MLQLWTREQCEEFQMMRFGISCATCERSDEECPWHRQDEPEQRIFVSENRFPHQASPILRCSCGINDRLRC
jgi:hypothetical protein